LRAKALNRLIELGVVAYRLTGGRIAGRMSGAPVLLLDHVGRRSGKARVTPLIYTRDGENLVIIASRGGSDAMPAWLLNLRDAPGTTVQLRSERFDVVAREAAGEERERLWKLASANYPYYDDYQRRTERQIPVVVLEPVSRRPG
jgi:deazaflavin-dependent oxidoreductase (nitroreductase family)